MICFATINILSLYISTYERQIRPAIPILKQLIALPRLDFASLSQLSSRSVNLPIFQLLIYRH